jgi:5-methylcytosine-specific restriction endonuclease McrA
VFAGALKVLLDKIDPDRRRRRRDRARRLAAGARSRKIPQPVKDEVWDRDGGRCAYRSDAGRVCGARAGLEFDHVRPWALGGGSGDAGNIRLLCRSHNELEARRAFGGALVDAAVARRRHGLRRGVEI